MNDVQQLPLKSIDLWGNYRKTIDKKKLDELAASIKEHGVLQAVLARPSPTKPGRFELLVGSRRFKGSTLAGKEDIPATVRELTDIQAAKLQLIENIHREDPHPLEEAEAFEALHVKHKMPVDDIAAEIGKPKAYVYERLKLCALTAAGRKAFYEGHLTPTTALLLARIPVPKLQDQALADFKNWGSGEPISRADANGIVQRTYMLKLADAPFNAGDAELVKKAGSCSDCPKRTGKTPELFPDVKSDMCTDPTCFAEKKAAAWKKRTATAKEKGQKVLSDAESKKLFPYRGSRPDGYAELSQKCFDDPKQRTWRSLMGKHAPTPVLAKDESGDTHELVPLDAAKKAVKAAGHKFGMGRTPERDTSHSKSERAAAKKAKALRERTTKRMGEMVKRAERREADVRMTRLFVTVLVERTCDHESVAAAVKRRGLQPKTKAKYSSPERPILSKAVAKMNGAELRGLAVELVAHTHVGPNQGGLGKQFTSFAKFYGVK
jgi:ParB family transcriptional regulator, chromosome partitioning protein